ncbi:MAG TPA: XdhC family protein [Vicinamibacterales bacterium]|jgi:xanthine/CO dehydrogenase XdhC/CoxF family maturation factor|nr:XdhC family protein [Vicinamibacterales bacterium]
MKHWRETTEIVRRVLHLASMGRRSALATVIDISGSAYRRPGAKLLVEEDGPTLGGVSGGCLEADVREIARAVIGSGAPRLLHYDTGTDDRTVWGLGLGCNGSVDIFVQSAADSSALDTIRTVRALLDRSDTFAISTIVSGASDVGRTLIVSESGDREGSTGNADLDRDLGRIASSAIPQLRSRVDRLGPLAVFSDVLVAPPKLIVCGAGDDAMPLVAYAADAGFAVTVVDHRPAYLAMERFPAARLLIEARPDGDASRLSVDVRTLVVVKMHAFEHDRDWLRLFLDTETPYIGLLGPRARAEKLLQLAGSRGGQRVYGPVGLDVGAEGPEQIAISIVAELLAVHARQQPGHLRERGAAIHAV